MANLHSMTGFASVSGGDDTLSWVMDLRGVNARGLDLRFRLPETMTALEASFRSKLQARLTRGAVSLAIRVERQESSGGVALNTAQLAAYFEALGDIRQQAAALGHELAPVTLGEVLTLRGVLASEASPAQAPVEALGADFGTLLSAFEDMRAQEGAALKAVLDGRLAEMRSLHKAALRAAQARRESQSGRLKDLLTQALGDLASADPDRVAQELALIAVKSDVSEELDRLDAHISAAAELLKTGGPVGRKLDFLMQEFNREANTLCSKSGSTELTRVGLEMKHVIDQMREQVQNVE